MCQGRAGLQEGGKRSPTLSSKLRVSPCSEQPSLCRRDLQGLRKVPIATANPAPAPWPGSGQFSMDTASPAVQARRGL